MRGRGLRGDRISSGSARAQRASCGPGRRSRLLPVLDVAQATPAGVSRLWPCPEPQSTPWARALVIGGILRPRAAFALCPVLDVAQATPAGVSRLWPCPEPQSTPWARALVMGGILRPRAVFALCPVLDVARAAPAGVQSLRPRPEVISMLQTGSRVAIIADEG